MVLRGKGESTARELGIGVTRATVSTTTRARDACDGWQRAPPPYAFKRARRTTEVHQEEETRTPTPTPSWQEVLEEGDQIEKEEGEKALARSAQVRLGRVAIREWKFETS